jgi:hypothetical protein
MVTNKKKHWFVSPTGHMFYAFKFLKQWRFVGKDTWVIKEKPDIASMKKYVAKTFGFEYVGYM